MATDISNETTDRLKILLPESENPDCLNARIACTHLKCRGVCTDFEISNDVRGRSRFNVSSALALITPKSGAVRRSDDDSA